MSECDFIKKLLTDSPLTPKGVKNLLYIIKEAGDIEEAMMIYEKHDFSVLLDYRRSLITSKSKKNNKGDE